MTPGALRSTKKKTVVFCVFFLGPLYAYIWLMAYFMKKGTYEHIKKRNIWTYYSNSISLLKQIYLQRSPSVNHWSHSLPFTLKAHVLGDPFQKNYPSIFHFGCCLHPKGWRIGNLDPLVIHSAPLAISPFALSSGHDPPLWTCRDAISDSTRWSISLVEASKCLGRGLFFVTGDFWVVSESMQESSWPWEF